MLYSRPTLPDSSLHQLEPRQAPYTLGVRKFTKKAGEDGNTSELSRCLHTLTQTAEGRRGTHVLGLSLSLPRAHTYPHTRTLSIPCVITCKIFKWLHYLHSRMFTILPLLTTLRVLPPATAGKSGARPWKP